MTIWVVIAVSILRATRIINMYTRWQLKIADDVRVCRIG